MQYPKNIEVKLGFDEIRNLLMTLCQSTLGTHYVQRMKFGTDSEVIAKFIGQTQEFKQIIEGDNSFPQSNYLDVTASLERAKVEGVFLSEEELHDISISLTTIVKCLDFLLKFQDEFPLLHALAKGIDLENDLSKEIDLRIDEKGQLRNNATPELSKIRHNMHNEQSKLRKQINSALKNFIGQGLAREDANITLRGGRMVIPILAEHKRKIQGFIHDESSTGQLVYIEPAAVLEVNNAIKDLEYQEKREIVRILMELTDRIRPQLPSLKIAYQFLGMMDFIRAKARLAIKINAVMPEISNQKTIEWKEARHPLLFIAHQKLQKPIVPLNIYLDRGQRIIVISGPNAGGKSVCLKTVGLIQYMFQSGMLIPVQEGSSIGIFKNLMIDIGDEQSIENDLSTYSSHLTNMKNFLKNSDRDTLFLIDEFGTGTDPNFGGIIAEVILDKLNQQQAYGVINTHYGNLKQFAENEAGIVNGAMRFDMQRLEPLYLLEIGKPGSSFALEIAYKIGLSHQLINEVKEKLGEDKVNFDKMLSRIERDKQYYDEKRAEIKRKDKELKQLVQRYDRLHDELESQKKIILNKAKEEAGQLLSDTNQRIEATIKSIKEHKADKTITKEVRENLEVLKKKVKTEKIKPKQEKLEVVGGVIEVGCFVKIKDQTTIGEVLALKGKDAEIRIGSLTSKVKLNRLERISSRSYRSLDRADSPSTTPSKTFDVTSKNLHFSSNIDVRGKRTEEAIVEVDNLIDGAILMGAAELTIIHGKGDGILREMIRKHLRTYPQVKNIHDEHADRGGAGITIFELK